MGKFAGKFESAKQDWETPWDFFKPIDDEFHFTLDAAASPLNTKVRDSFLTEIDDGLHTDWQHHIVWINPPYGKEAQPIKAWVQKCHDAARQGATCVILIPARTNTNWFHDLCLKHGEVRFVRGRPKFVGADHGLPQPLCLVIFRPPPTARPIPLT